MDKSASLFSFNGITSAEIVYRLFNEMRLCRMKCSLRNMKYSVFHRM